MTDRFVSRGFVGRRRDPGSGNRIPPGQHQINDFPVLSAGPTPLTPLESWSFSIEGLVDQPARWTWVRWADPFVGPAVEDQAGGRARRAGPTYS
jgi:hypothetical protein